MVLPVGKWQNPDGLQVPFGDFWKNSALQANVVRAVNTLGGIKQVVIDIDLTKIADGTVSYTSDLNNDGTLDGFNTGDFYLPARSSVVRCTLVTVVAAAGGTSFAIGTYGLTGTAIDADGIATDTECVTANFAAIGDRVYGNGAYVATTAGTDGIGSADGYIGVAATGTFTAGKIRAIIEYIEPIADAA